MINIPETAQVTCDQCAATIEMPITEYRNQTFGICEDNLDGEGWYIANDNADGEHFCPECSLVLNLLDTDDVQARFDKHQITVQMIGDSEHYHILDDTIYNEPMAKCQECGEIFPKAQDFCDCQNEPENE